MTTARSIDLWTGLVFALLGVLGLFTSSGLLLGFIPTNTAMALVYLVTAIFLLYGYFSSDGAAHTVSAFLGVIYAALGVIGFFSATFLGLPTSGWDIGVNLLAAVVLIYDWLGVPRVALEKK